VDPWHAGRDPWALARPPPLGAAPLMAPAERPPPPPRHAAPDPRELITKKQKTQASPGERAGASVPASAPSTLPTSAPTSSFRAGMSVVLINLKRRDMNGLRGTVTSADGGSRVPVLLDGRDQPIAFKPDNLADVAAPLPAGTMVELINQEPGRHLASGMRGVVRDYIPSEGAYAVLITSLGGQMARLLPDSVRPV